MFSLYPPITTDDILTDAAHDPTVSDDMFTCLASVLRGDFPNTSPAGDPAALPRLIGTRVDVERHDVMGNIEHHVGVLTKVWPITGGVLLIMDGRHIVGLDNECGWQVNSATTPS